MKYGVTITVETRIGDDVVQTNVLKQHCPDYGELLKVQEALVDGIFGGLLNLGRMKLAEKQATESLMRNQVAAPMPEHEAAPRPQPRYRD